MNKCLTIEEGVKSALKVYECTPKQKWAFQPAKNGELYDKLILDNEEYPLLWHRCDPQLLEIHELAPLRDPCSIKLNRCVSKQVGLDSIMCREFDIAEWVLGSEVKSIMCFKNDNAANVIATMKNDCVAVFELSAVLNENTSEQGRHTLWGKNGMVSDMVISQKNSVNSAYVFTEDKVEPKTYNDLFLHMFDLSRIDTIKAACITEILLGSLDISNWKATAEKCKKYLSAAYKSAESCERVFMESEG